MGRMFRLHVHMKWATGNVKSEGAGWVESMEIDLNGCNAELKLEVKRVDSHLRTLEVNSM